MLEQNILVVDNWLKSHVAEEWNYSLLIYTFPFPHYNMIVPWYSGMAHDNAIQALMIA